MSRDQVRSLAEAAQQQGNPTGWFEEVYAQSKAGKLDVPWDDNRPNPWLLRWLDSQPFPCGTALDVGCGLGDNAEELARRGMKVTGADVSETAIALAKERFPETKVDYVARDLLAPPPEWKGKFDFINEIYTLQAIPKSVRRELFATLCELLAPGGVLLVIQRYLPASEPEADGPPWKLTIAELDATMHGLVKTYQDIDEDPEESDTQRITLAFQRPPR